MKPTLQWPKQPSKSRHHILGRRLRWTDRSKRTASSGFPTMAILSSSSCLTTGHGGSSRIIES